MGFIGCLLGTHYYAYKNGQYSTVCILSIFYCSSTVIPQPLHQLQTLHEWCVNTKGVWEKALLKHNSWVWQFFTFRGEMKLGKADGWGEACLVCITPPVLTIRISASLCQTWNHHHVGPLQIIILCASPITPSVKWPWGIYWHSKLQRISFECRFIILEWNLQSM